MHALLRLPSPALRIRWRRGRVTTTGRRGRDSLELTVEVPGDGQVRALAYPSLVGIPQVGDDVLLNTTALAQELGTGGVALVVAVPDRLPPDPEGPGHLVKARYTPLQVTVQGVDEQDTEHHAVLAEADDIAGMPVVVADLHSALPAILIGSLATDPDLRVAYVMPDGAPLPAAFSRTLDVLAPSLAGVITVGQAYGGDLEAVTVHTGLLAAKHVLHADLAIVTQGPGNLGTGTPLGFSGVAAGEACNAVHVLGGRADRRAAHLRGRSAAAASRGVAPLAHGVRADRARRGHADRTARPVLGARRPDRRGPGRSAGAQPGGVGGHRRPGGGAGALPGAAADDGPRLPRGARLLPAAAAAGRYAALAVPLPEDAADPRGLRSAAGDPAEGPGSPVRDDPAAAAP